MILGWFWLRPFFGRAILEPFTSSGLLQNNDDDYDQNNIHGIYNIDMIWMDILYFARDRFTTAVNCVNQGCHTVFCI